MIEIDPDVTLPTEPPGTEFSYNFFKELPPVKVGQTIVEGVKIKPNPNMFFKEVDLTLPLRQGQLGHCKPKMPK